jgi:hypothetical protein
LTALLLRLSPMMQVNRRTAEELTQAKAAKPE